MIVNIANYVKWGCWPGRKYLCLCQNVPCRVLHWIMNCFLFQERVIFRILPSHDIKFHFLLHLTSDATHVLLHRQNIAALHHGSSCLLQSSAEAGGFFLFQYRNENDFWQVTDFECDVFGCSLWTQHPYRYIPVNVKFSTTQRMLSRLAFQIAPR